MSEERTGPGWPHLRPDPKDVDPKAIKMLPSSVYGIAGLTAIKEWWLWERLEQSGLTWSFEIEDITYLGSETKTTRASQGRDSYEYTIYLASARGYLEIDGRKFPAVGASDNRALDAAFTGAVTSAFKNACKWAGLTLHLYKDGKLADSFEEWERDELAKEAAKKPPVESRSAATGQAAVPAPAQQTVNPGTSASNGQAQAPVDPAAEQQKIAALVWFAGQIPDDDPDKKHWAQNRIIMELSLYEKRKRDGKLSEKEIQYGSSFRAVFARIRDLHRKASNCGESCPHENPVVTVFKLGGDIQNATTKSESGG